VNPSLREAVRHAAKTLADAGIDSPDADAVALAASVLKTTTSEVRKMMIMGAPAPDGLDDLVAERARRVPLQHLTGKSGFRRLELSVGPGVFVPRFETELVAGLAISHLIARSRQFARPTPADLGSLPGDSHGSRQFARPTPADLGSLPGDSHGSRQIAPSVATNVDNLRYKLPRSAPEPRTNRLDRWVVVDLCTGSGAIALAVKDEVPAAEVHAVELSDLAHAWAVRNRDDLGLDVDIRLGDATLAFPDLEGDVDVVVSNPPYIPVGAVPNDPEVRDHDPSVALYGGSSDGLRIPLEVAARAAILLRSGGFLVMEHADVQGISLPAALRATGCWRDIQDHLDLNGRPRAVTAMRAD
jgi:release factor glutamine methyltransferase